MQDRQLMVDISRAVTTGTQLCTDSIDMRAVGTIPGLGGSPIADIGRGHDPLIMQVLVVVAFTGGTSLQVQLVMADDAALSSALTVIQETPAIAEASLVAGYSFRLGPIPPGISQRFLGIRYVTVGTHGAGQITAGLVMERGTGLGQWI